MLKKNDFLLIGILGILILISFFVLGGKKEEGSKVVITIAGKEYGIFSLEEDNKVEILEIGRNVLQIQDGYAKMIEADCPDLLCIHQKKIYKKGETIVCLPNKVVVEVIKGEENGLDSIAN